jgi:archaeosine synthase beta-subunit
MPSFNELPVWDDAAILALRPAKNAVDIERPYAFFVEPERSRQGVLADVATLLLTNRECPFRCLMCDLWKNTTGARVPLGSIPAQIEYALSRLPKVQHVKLYNAGNFFDAQAVPPADVPVVARQLARMETVIIECHPLLVNERCLAFRDQLGGGLVVAMGLETIHPDVLPRLNKRMTLDDFRRAANFLTANGIFVRAFLLLRPPYLKEEEGVEWACRSLEFAFDAGVECSVVIPMRAGNGAIDMLQQQGHFSPPMLASLERVLEWGINQHRGRVFADLWDIDKLFDCPQCGSVRAERLRQMNYMQTILPAVQCACRTS